MKKTMIRMTLSLVLLLMYNLLAIGQVKVNSAQSFVDNAKSNTEIKLSSDRIVLSELNSSSNPNVFFEEVYGSSGKEVHIKNVKNLVIDGENREGKAHLVTEPTYGNVLVFENCQNITIKNIIAGHGPEKGQCLGGVLKFVDCYMVNIEGAILYGSGTYGITAEKVRRLECKETIIKECTYGIIDFDYVEGFVFEDCKFRKNKEYDMLDLQNSTGSFIRIQVKKNETNDYGKLFSVNNCKLAIDGMFLEQNTFKGGLCNDWSSFTRIDFFGFELTKPMDKGIEKQLQSQAGKNRSDLVGKWKLESIKKHKEPHISTPKEDIVLEINEHGKMSFVGGELELLGQMEMAPFNEDHIIIGAKFEEQQVGIVTKIYKADDAASFSFSFLYGDLAELHFVKAEDNNENIKEKNEILTYVETQNMGGGEAQITFKMEKGGFLVFYVDITGANEFEKMFIGTTNDGNIVTVEPLKNLDFIIDYTEREYEDPDTGGGMTEMKITNAVEVQYTE